MSADPEDLFVEKIEKNLAKNGFPEKKVSLPLAKVEASARDNELDLEMILSRLSMTGVYSCIVEDKIYFAAESISASDFSASVETPPSGMPDLSGMFSGGMPDLSSFAGKNPQQMQEQAMKIMEGMTPEQQEKLMQMWMNMPAEEKENLMDKVKGMGVNPN